MRTLGNTKEYVVVSINICPYSIPVQRDLLTLLHNSRVPGCIWVFNFEQWLRYILANKVAALREN